MTIINTNTLSTSHSLMAICDVAASSTRFITSISLRVFHHIKIYSLSQWMGDGCEGVLMAA
jgi:hypothetical protein